MVAKSKLVGKDGNTLGYPELLAQADPGIAKEINQDVFSKRYSACQHAISTLAATIREAQPDIIVSIGDDQNEVLHPDNMPAFSMYWGDEMLVTPRDQRGGPSYMEWSAWSYGKEERSYPVASDLSKYLISGMIEHEFDVATHRSIPGGRGIGHAFGFIQERILDERPVPTVPIMINTFYAPNQPTAKRCFDFGEAIREIIEQWPADKKVCVLASGGLSHFVVDEELDQRVLTALKKKDRDALNKIQQCSLQSGTSEARNWIATAAAVDHLDMELIDYVPCYRTPAGTGCAMAFARWN